ncbi:MAG: preprotein translocase subunit SecE [Rhodothalassiaceae bacterium]
MARTNPAQFVRQVKQEADKIAWPTRKETAITTLMVGIMVALTAVFFVLVDFILASGIKLLLGLGG